VDKKRELDKFEWIKRRKRVKRLKKNFTKRKNKILETSNPS
jgi:hypothetical protein